MGGDARRRDTRIRIGLVVDRDFTLLKSVHTNAGWLFVKALRVAQTYRSQGYGTQLLHAAENEARARDCIGVYLDTYSFQARPFYERQGYRVFGELPDHPPGGAKYYLAKRLKETTSPPK
jgi:GNAT superfamily N-acetyltransferase